MFWRFVYWLFKYDDRIDDPPYPNDDNVRGLGWRGQPEGRRHLRQR